MIMEAFDVEIVQTIKVVKRIIAQDMQDAVRKGNNIVSNDEIPLEEYQMLEADVKANKADNVIPFRKL